MHTSVRIVSAIFNYWNTGLGMSEEKDEKKIWVPDHVTKLLNELTLELPYP